MVSLGLRPDEAGTSRSVRPPIVRRSSRGAVLRAHSASHTGLLQVPGVQTRPAPTSAPGRTGSGGGGVAAASSRPGPPPRPAIGCCFCTPIAASESGWETAVRAFIAAPDAAGRAGYFAFALDDPSSAARRLERIVRWRCSLLALPYGDQGLLISRRLYDAVGGFATIPLMEDVDLVRRLGRRRLATIPVPLHSSARRYREEGYFRRPLRNLFCLSLYFAGVPPRHIARLYG